MIGPYDPAPGASGPGGRLPSEPPPIRHPDWCDARVCRVRVDTGGAHRSQVAVIALHSPYQLELSVWMVNSPDATPALAVDLHDSRIPYGGGHLGGLLLGLPEARAAAHAVVQLCQLTEQDPPR